MKTTIWKYPLVVDDLQTVKMPFGAKILCVQMQGSTPCLWALVNPDEPRVLEHRIHIYGTGHPMPPAPGTYIGTFQTGPYVFHVFDC